MEALVHSTIVQARASTLGERTSTVEEHPNPPSLSYFNIATVYMYSSPSLIRPPVIQFP